MSAAWLIIKSLLYNNVAPANVDIHLNKVKNYSCTLNFPANDTVFVDLSFRMLTYLHFTPHNNRITCEENFTTKPPNLTF